MHFIAEAWRLITPTAIENYCVSHCFANDVNSNNDSALKLSENDDDWHSSQPLEAQSEDYTTVLLRSVEHS
jgi:hypothetical protein